MTNYSSSHQCLNTGNTALGLALQWAKYDVAKLLIKHGATEFRIDSGKKIMILDYMQIDID